jgi:hypothetical protein
LEIGRLGERGIGREKDERPTSNIERRIGKIKNTGEGEVWKWECGLSEL